MLVTEVEIIIQYFAEIRRGGPIFVREGPYQARQADNETVFPPEVKVRSPDPPAGQDG